MPYELVRVVVALVIAGLILWGVSQFNLDDTIAKLIKVVVVVVACIYVLYFLMGMVPGGGLALPYRGR